MHYMRWRRLGSPTASLRRLGRSDSERFWAFVDKSGPCWLWTGAISHGYGNFFLRRPDGSYRQVQAHRWAYEERVGAIPVDLVIDHLCRVRNCVNPRHLQPVKQQVNCIRGDQATVIKTNRCRNGHDYTSGNTYVNVLGAKVCLICRRASEARYRARKRAARQG